MMSEPEKIKDLQYSFSGFLWKSLDKIQEAWLDENDLVKALYRALSLVKYLPVAIKKDLERDVEIITKEFNATYNVEGHDFHSTMLRRNKAGSQVAQKYLPYFINKMLTLLDKRGYLERGTWQPITQQDFKKKFEGEGETVEG